MKIAKYIQQDFIAPADLETLGNTYNTLETGHQEAIKAASNLRTAVAALEMDSSEDGFKEQLIGEIENTINQNTIYGNSYAALDNITKQTGDIMSDGRIIGRLRNHQLKKEYDAKIDTMAIPEGMKQMYKDENPYYYEDGDIDANTGRVLPGEEWKAKTNPVSNVPITTIQAYALQIAATEKGNGETITFLDVNGKETSDPSKSVDGLMYRKIGMQYERLSADKISSAYRQAIASIPGAEDSLRQDYKYAGYQYKKVVENAIKNNGDSTPYMEGYTDKNGNVYLYNQWLDNKINGFAEVAAYDYRTSTIDYGTALQAKRARETSTTPSTGEHGVVVNPDGRSNEGFGTGYLGMQKEESNAYAGAVNSQKAAEKSIMNILYTIPGYENKTSIKEIFDESNETDIKHLLKNIAESSNLNSDQKNALSIAGLAYTNAQSQINRMLEAAGADGDALKFSAAAINDNFDGDDRYSKEIKSYTNTVRESNLTHEITIGRDVMPNLLAQYGYNKNEINKLRELGIQIRTNPNDSYTAVITPENANRLPRFSNNLVKAYNATPGSLRTWGTQVFTTSTGTANFTVRIKDVNDNTISTSDDEIPTIIRNKNNTFSVNTPSVLGYTPYAMNSNIADLYDYALKQAETAEEKVGITDGYAGVYNFNASSYEEMYITECKTDWTDTQRERQIKLANDNLDLQFATNAAAHGAIYIRDEFNHITKLGKEAYDAQLMLNTLYNSNSNKPTRRVVYPRATGVGQPAGYTHTFTVPKDMGNNTFKEGQTYTLITEGSLEEGVPYDPSYNPTVLAGNMMQHSRATGGDVDNLGFVTEFGDTRLIYNPRENNYTTSFLGQDFKLNAIPNGEAEQYLGICLTLEQLKAKYQNGTYNLGNIADAQLLENSINTIAINISQISNNNLQNVQRAILNYLNNTNE